MIRWIGNVALLRSQLRRQLPLDRRHDLLNLVNFRAAGDISTLWAYSIFEVL
jgi:hypothetical protein